MGKAIDADTELTWYALRTPPEQRLMELTVRVLRNAGLIADIAMEKRMRRRTRHDKVRQMRPYVVAPSYVFVCTPDGSPMPWHKVFRLHMVRAVIAINGRPAPLNDEAVRRFLRWDGERLPGYLRFMRTGHEFSPGDKVYITEGPLADYTETCPMRVEEVEDGEAVFLIRLLGHDIRHKVDVNACVKAA